MLSINILDSVNKYTHHDHVSMCVCVYIVYKRYYERTFRKINMSTKCAKYMLTDTYIFMVQGHWHALNSTNLGSQESRGCTKHRHVYYQTLFAANQLIINRTVVKWQHERDGLKLIAQATAQYFIEPVHWSVAMSFVRSFD